MRRKRSLRLLASYLASLLVALGLLVVWVVFAVRSGARLAELGERVGVASDNAPWIVLAVGCGLCFLLVGGITYQLAQALAERRWSEKQDEFVANVTHEMKSPVAAIKLHAQTLEDDDLPAADRRRSVAFILQQAERMEVLVDNVLESSRLQARKRAVAFSPVDLAGFLAGYFEEARHRLGTHGVNLRPRIETAATVLATPEGLRRILDNLLDNAARFSATGGEVRCHVHDRGAEVLLEVEDDGVGIPKKELAKVFDRFYQAGRAGDGRRRGTGLGLAIVSGLVREMKGTVSAFSAEGRPGARFVIALPAVAAAAGGERRGR